MWHTVKMMFYAADIPRGRKLRVNVLCCRYTTNAKATPKAERQCLNMAVVGPKSNELIAGD